MIETELGYGLKLYTTTCHRCGAKISALNEQTLNERVAKHICKHKTEQGKFSFNVDYIAGEKIYKAKCNRCGTAFLAKKSRQLRSIVKKHSCKGEE